MPDDSLQNKYPTHPPITRKNGFEDPRSHQERSHSQMIKNINSRIKQYRTSSPRNTNAQFDRRRSLPNVAKIRSHNLKKAAKRSFKDGSKIDRNLNIFHAGNNHKKGKETNPTQLIYWWGFYTKETNV